MALVFDRADHASFAPVHRGWEILWGLGKGEDAGVRKGRRVAVHLPGDSRAPERRRILIRECVHTHLVARSASIVLENALQVAFKEAAALGGSLFVKVGQVRLIRVRRGELVVLRGARQRRWAEKKS